MGLISDKVGEAKAWYESKTIIGIILMFIPNIIKMFYPELAMDLTGAVDESFVGAGEIATASDKIWVLVLEIVGLAIATWGRIKAKVGLRII